MTFALWYLTRSWNETKKGTAVDDDHRYAICFWDLCIGDMRGGNSSFDVFLPCLMFYFLSQELCHSLSSAPIKELLHSDFSVFINFKMLMSERGRRIMIEINSPDRRW